MHHLYETNLIAFVSRPLYMHTLCPMQKQYHQAKLNPVSVDNAMCSVAINITFFLLSHPHSIPPSTTSKQVEKKID